MTTMTVKPMPLVTGLSARGMKTSSPLVTNFMCMPGWVDLQATPHGPLTHPNPIDDALASGKSFRVRLNFGKFSAAWAYKLAGVKSINVVDTFDNVTGQVPTWWINSLMLAQANLITRLAEAYDGKISAIFIGTNMTIYCEPYIRQISSDVTRSNMVKAGYTSQVDKASYDNCLHMFNAFKQTRLAWSFNPWQLIDANGLGRQDVTETLAQIANFRKLHPSGILCNNSIRFPPLGNLYGQMYTALKGNKPLAFQTATLPRIGDLTKTLTWAVQQGAHCVELPSGYETVMTPAQIKYYNGALKANA